MHAHHIVFAQFLDRLIVWGLPEPAIGIYRWELRQDHRLAVEATAKHLKLVANEIRSDFASQIWLVPRRRISW